MKMASTPTAMMLAWEHALTKFEASMSANDLEQIQQSTALADIVTHLEKWTSTKETDSGKLSNLLQDRTTRVQRFAGAIDQFAQDVVQPACLIWGAIRYVLVVRSISTRT